MAPCVGGHEQEALGAIDYRRITSGGMMAPRVGGHEYESPEAIDCLIMVSWDDKVTCSSRGFNLIGRNVFDYVTGFT